MKIERHLVPESTLEDFADKHGLVMVVNERPTSYRPLKRFYVKFSHIEIKDGRCLISPHGNGDTEEEAIADYAQCISECSLVYKAFSEDRKEIRAPRFITV